MTDLPPAARRVLDYISRSPNVSVEIPCGPFLHTLRWSADGLELPDHDVEPEQVLDAMGADPPECVRVLEAWRRFDLDPKRREEMLLALLCDEGTQKLRLMYGSRAHGGLEQLMAMSRTVGGTDQQLAPVAALIQPARDYFLLLGLPLELRMRLGAEAVAGRG